MAGAHDSGDRTRLAIALAALGAARCSPQAPSRAELLVVVDTDAHVVGELASRPEVSADAAIDALRIDVLDASDNVYATNLFLVADFSSWPVSFGLVPAPDTASQVRLRLRAFRGLFSQPGSVDGTSTMDPLPEVTIDRVVWLTLPLSGVTRAEISLFSDCFGVVPSFAAPQTTCVDGTHRSGSPTDGVTLLAGDSPPTQVGTWPGALERPCATTPSGGRVCIPGGFSVLGDYSAVGGPNATPDQEPIPLHPAILTPFLLDREECTVGRARALVTSGALSDSMLRARAPSDPLNRYCTWLGASDPSNDNLPLNCVAYDVALLVCQLSQGTLPSEAQWLHAARGRGEGLRYPWGNDYPTCCALTASRSAAFVTAPECDGGGVQQVASHPPSASCAGLGDVSRDGIDDLAGSVTEILLDEFENYADQCWGTGVLHDPICHAATDGGTHVAHGGAWSAPLSDALLAPRGYADDGPDFGFRCAYPDTP
jgi:formylglycine-generating enzyme required for sulfatase activity